MKATELEQKVIERMLADRGLNPLRSRVDFASVEVLDRWFSGVGFMAEFVDSEELQVFDAEVSLRWGDVGARLNSERIETGYLVYVDAGRVSTIEGYTYGDEWPEQVEKFELYEIRLGEPLLNPPK
ncbi:hypothetical protein [Vulgatibacter incomptus]|uniref:Uncharacterized protein n=1 Tax=Vulgatibacter incomptus TaxID=1391653 RepID=A0A0K1PG44_9BACT|nr:hypothetical protein [Vulgatibacter incomptus]AKU92477.1 hypothetical protein AKJ08_2864 [Vulgatibacter incomptus]